MKPGDLKPAEPAKYHWHENQGSWNAHGQLFDLSVDEEDDEFVACLWQLVGGGWDDPPFADDVDSRGFPDLATAKRWAEAQDQSALAHEILADIEISEVPDGD